MLLIHEIQLIQLYNCQKYIAASKTEQINKKKTKQNKEFVVIVPSSFVFRFSLGSGSAYKPHYLNLFVCD